jgi:hypothetical protein
MLLYNCRKTKILFERGFIMTRTELKNEAIKRCEILKGKGAFKQSVNQFIKSDKVSVSEPPFGAFYWLNEEEQKQVEDFEKQYNSLVYMVIRSFTEFGTLDSYLYVSQYKEEWEQDLQDLKEGCPLCYVYNKDCPEFSEFGSIGFEVVKMSGGLKRIW